MQLAKGTESSFSKCSNGSVVFMKVGEFFEQLTDYLLLRTGFAAWS
jgi:hypothetical protein